jgi:hypothetical protein
MTTTLLPPRLETVPSMTERCDRCAAAGKLHITLASGGQLVFCGHHGNRHTDDILRQARHIAAEEGFEWRGAHRARTTSAG